jgi:hypothetical protein
LKQFFQPLSVTTVFGMETIDLCAQRGILYFIHQAPPSVKEHLDISPSEGNSQGGKLPKPEVSVNFAL